MQPSQTGPITNINQGCQDGGENQSSGPITSKAMARIAIRVAVKRP